MADTFTPVLGLTKPDFTGPADIRVMSANMDLIDTAIGTAMGTPPTDVTIGGDLTVDGVGRRIRGDFSAPVNSDRVLFQTTVLNSDAVVGVIPNGTGHATSLAVYDSADPDNAAIGGFGVGATAVVLGAVHSGAATTRPIEVRIDTVPRARFHVSGGISLLDATDPGPGTVRVGGALAVTGGAVVCGTGTTLGFFGSAGGPKPAVTGAKGGNAALASLCTALAALGLLTDSTT